MVNFDEANAQIAAWGKSRVPELQQEMDRLGIRHSANSSSAKAARNSLRNTNRKNRGLINRISFSIPRHMVYVAKGVGRGTTASQVGTTNRRAKNWFNPVIDRNIDKLADIVAEEIGGALINNLLIK